MTVTLAGAGSPNCCGPSYPKPESMSRALIIGAGDLPDQIVGTARVILFPDELTTNEYLSWYDRVSADGGDGGSMSDPILRACNAVVLPGGGVVAGDDEAGAPALMRVARSLAAHCPDDDGKPMKIESVGGKH